MIFCPAGSCLQEKKFTCSGPGWLEEPQRELPNQEGIDYIQSSPGSLVRMITVSEGVSKRTTNGRKAGCFHRDKSCTQLSPSVLLLALPMQEAWHSSSAIMLACPVFISLFPLPLLKFRPHQLLTGHPNGSSSVSLWGGGWGPPCAYPQLLASAKHAALYMSAPRPAGHMHGQVWVLSMGLGDGSRLGVSEDVERPGGKDEVRPSAPRQVHPSRSHSHCQLCPAMNPIQNYLGRGRQNWLPLRTGRASHKGLETSEWAGALAPCRGKMRFLEISNICPILLY